MAEEHYSTEGPVCPICGHQHRADDAFYFDESMVAMDCEACERDFSVRVYTSTSWTTRERYDNDRPTPEIARLNKGEE